MSFDEIKTPQELLKFMDIIEYGFVSKDGIKYGSWDEEEFEKNVITKWHLESPEKLILNKYGHCFDQVELERAWFTKNNYKFHTYYIMFFLDYPNDYSTHTFLIYEENKKFYLFEHADYFNRGIHEFSTLELALQSEMQYHLNINSQYNPINEKIINSLHIYEYDNIPYDINFNDFINLILNQNKALNIKIKQ